MTTQDIQNLYVKYILAIYEEKLDEASRLAELLIAVARRHVIKFLIVSKFQKKLILRQIELAVEEEITDEKRKYLEEVCIALYNDKL